MKTAILHETLKDHPFVEGFPEEHMDKLAAMALDVHFETDQLIFRLGDESSLFYLLTSGKVALEVPAPGRTFRIQTLGPGDELGWSSVMTPVRKQFQAKSIEPVTAVAFDGARMLRACDEDPAFGYTIMRRVAGIVAERLENARIQLMDVYKPVGAKMI